MNQKSIFLFILLISLSATNAIPFEKRATQFQDCIDENDNFRNAEFINVSMSIDPLVSNQNVIFDVSGTLKNDIKDNGLVIAQLVDEDDNNIYRFRINATATKAGQKFDIKTPQHNLPDIPGKYNLTVFIVNPSNPPNDNEDAIGCAKTSVGF
ncbi:hypothetical protein F8M41_023064 [Gigaspora margarita]|uniref:MD-2-related lipid-recognition domain-containing protein n=1 Tax=Gigaspora margarita TaxID=4874 RepID=A0A8H4AE38_GIGMA|nr:hypothetical protein F8M41_023064 [Gigaspora margarita]